MERCLYQLRGSARLTDGSVVDYSDRTDHVAHFIVAPDDAPAWATDWKELWTRAAAAETRANAQEARLIELSLPRALARKDWIEIARRVAKALAKRGMVVQVDIHCSIASDGGLNPHVHFMLTMREIKNGQFAQNKARHWNREFYGKASVIRRDMAEVLNQYCQKRGVDYHADPRSNLERGLAPAEVHLPRWTVRHYKRTGKKTPALERRDRERAARAELARLEAECRKVERELELAWADEAALIAPTSSRQSVARPIRLSANGITARATPDVALTPSTSMDEPSLPRQMSRPSALLNSL
jgi:hypothetical protein